MNVLHFEIQGLLSDGLYLLMRRYLRVIDPPLELINDYFVLLKFAVMVTLVSDSVVLVRCAQVGTELVDLLQGQFLRYLHLTLFLPPFLIV
jgi:hypothetical protein